MNEPLFGSVSPSWPTVPFPPAGWTPSSVPLAGGPVAGAASAMPGPPLGMISAMPPAAAPLSTNVTSVIGAVPIGATIPYAGTEVALGVPVTALLATIAVRRGQPLGPTNDQEIEDFIFDALELLPGASEVDVRCESGRVTFTGAVHYKRLKRDVGEIAWAIPGVNDVHNTITIAARRRARGIPQNESQAAVARKSA